MSLEPFEILLYLLSQKVYRLKCCQNDDFNMSKLFYAFFHVATAIASFAASTAIS